MEFQGFIKSDFETFQIEGLEQRMQAIQERIQPKFRAIGDILTADLSAKLGSEMFLHIAKHARRTVNPPNDTWLAIAGNKRGYKKHPHFQVCLWDDRAFIWLAFIYELPNKAKIAKNFIENIGVIKQELSEDFVVSLDHMKKDATALGEIDLNHALERFHNVKKAEFLIGKQLLPSDPIIQNGEEFIQLVIKTYEQLLPLYKLSYQ